MSQSNEDDNRNAALLDHPRRSPLDQVSAANGLKFSRWTELPHGFHRSGDVVIQNSERSFSEAYNSVHWSSSCGMRTSRRSRPKSKTIPVSGLSVFGQEQKAEFEAAHPDLTKLQVFNAMNQHWMELDPHMKLSYERKADYLRRSEVRKATARNTRDPLGSEQPPITGYSIFVRERHQSLKIADPSLTLSQRSARITAEWTGMSKAGKQPYINIAKRETRRLRQVPDAGEGGEELQSDPI